MSPDDDFRAFEVRYGARIRAALSHLRVSRDDKREVYESALTDAFMNVRLSTDAVQVVEAIHDVLRTHCSAVRRASRRAIREMHWEDGFELFATTAADSAEHRIRLWSWEELLLEKLSPGERVALEYRTMDGRSDREIAREHGLSETSVRGLRRRAIQKLRREVKLVAPAPEPSDL